MKWTLQLFLLITLISNAEGQDINKGSTAFSDGQVNIALDEINKVFIAPPTGEIQLKSAKSSISNFEVTFHNFPEEAKQAFYYAVSIWGQLISSPVTIHIEARWETLEGNILAKGSPAIFYNNFSGAPLRNVYYPVALAEKLSGRDMNSGAPDIICRFNSKYNWYFGTDGMTPSTHYDFVSSSLHEITHGLGFSGFLNEENGKGYYNNNNELPSVYDYFLFNNQDQQISDKSLFQSHSDELFKQITSENVKFCQASSTAQEQKMIDWIFAPPVWNDGTSIYHLKGYAYGEENGLMSPFAVKGQAIHNPGEITLAILAELGWKKVEFDFNPIKDLEKTVAEWPFQIGIISDDDYFTKVMVVYSFDGFSTAKSSVLQPNEAYSKFLGNMLLDNQSGNIQYYIEARTIDNRTFRHPSEAPAKSFSLNIGPDYLVPELFHNPVKYLAGGVSEVNLQAMATDNIGIREIKVDYKINGNFQEPIYLNCTDKDLFTGTLNFPFLPNENDRIEYRITAEDNSLQGNKRVYPSVGFQEIGIYVPFEPVKGYATQFDDNRNDFLCADFTISPLIGFSGNVLHTITPYPESAIKNEKYNIVAQLKYPVIIQQNGQLKFDEVVLVEPEHQTNQFNESIFWDYVIVEASKDGGSSWLPLSEKYNSGNNESWNAAFVKSLSSNTSTALPHESMFVNHTINLTHNTGLEAGDTAIFRFRLASDNSVNGFGWAIDNLEIQEFQDDEEKLFAGGSFLLYPNPAKNHLFIEWSKQEANKHLDVVITDIFGKIIRRENNIEPLFSPKTTIDLSDVNPGMYMVSINQGTETISTNKIIKN
jgi:hypothetical protein